VALAVTAFDDPYDQLQVRGRVVEVRPDDDLVVLDRLSRPSTSAGRSPGAGGRSASCS
jgi:hypothetical protein